MSPTPHPSRRFGYSWLWVLLPLCWTLWLSWKGTPNFPHADHWALESTMLLADADGTLNWGTMAEQMNDSRYLLPRVCHLLLARATHWNLQIEAAVCVLMGGGIAILTWWCVRRSLAGRTADGVAAGLSLLILSPHQTMNWNFGVQICYFLTVATGLGITAVFLTRWSLARQTAAGILTATAGAWSFAPGWLAWGLVIWGVLGWVRRSRALALATALLTVLAAIGLNAWIYFSGYAFQEGIPLSQKLLTQWHGILLYFMNTLGAPFAEGWLQSNNAGRARMQDLLAPLLSGILLLWLAALALWHRRDLLRRTGSTPSWMWAGLAGWSLLLTAVVSLARTGNTLSNAFASRYIAFTIWAWAAALILTFMLPPGRKRRYLLVPMTLLLLWGWLAGALTGVKQFQKDRYTMRLLQGALTMSAVAPEPLGLRGNDPMMHLILPRVERLDELGYLHPRLVRSQLVADAGVQESDLIEGKILDIAPGPPLRISGYAIDYRRHGPADSIVLSYQEAGGEEIWWTPITARVMEKSLKKKANAKGLEGEDARIGWVWEGGQKSSHYKTVTPPARPCTIRAYALDGITGTFYRLKGSLPLHAPQPVD